MFAQTGRQVKGRLDSARSCNNRLSKPKEAFQVRVELSWSERESESENFFDLCHSPIKAHN